MLTLNRCWTSRRRRHWRSGVGERLSYRSVLACDTKLWQLARAVKELKVPFISSGGIADARGLAASLALGAVVSCICC